MPAIHLPEELEDLEDVYLAEQVLERIKKGGERIYSSAEVEEIINAMED